MRTLINKLRGFVGRRVRALTFKQQVILIALVSFVSVVATQGLWDYFHDRSYEAQIQTHKSRAASAEAMAHTSRVAAEEFRAHRDQLALKLKETNQQLLDLHEQLLHAKQQTVITKKVYVQSQTHPHPSIPLSGNDDLDRQRLWADYQRLRREAQH